MPPPPIQNRVLEYPIQNRVKAEISKICKNCVEHIKYVEKSYWETDRTIDTKIDKLRIALKVEDNKDDNSKYRYSTEV